VDLVFYLTRAAWPYLKVSRGVVVNTASLTALMSFKNLGSLAHTTAKAGIIGMTRQLAMEGREHGIRANSISLLSFLRTHASRRNLSNCTRGAAKTRSAMPERRRSKRRLPTVTPSFFCMFETTGVGLILRLPIRELVPDTGAAGDARTRQELWREAGSLERTRSWDGN
jgi:NAD(P)-dependent dehydrogenase (short-subunit alcohol dehydrogenase family)